MATGPSLEAVALVFFAPSCSHAAARVQRRFRLLGCRTVPSPLGGSELCVATAWDVSNEEGTALAPAMLEAMRLLLGDEKDAAAGSVRAHCAPGAIIKGPVVDAKLAAQLQLVPTEPPPPVAATPAPAAPAPAAPAAMAAVPPSGKSQPSKQPSKQQAAAAPAARPPPPPPAPAAKAAATVSLTIGREAGGGVVLDIARVRPRVALEIARPAQPGGEWLQIRALSAPAADAKATPKKPKPTPPSKSAAPAAKPATTPSAAGAALHGAAKGGAPPPAGATTAPPPATRPPLDPAEAGPTFRSTRDIAAMQPMLRHASGGRHAEASFLFHAGRPPWHAAVSALQ
jgi:hypothetical protein